MRGYFKFSAGIFLFFLSCLFSSCGLTENVEPLNNTTVTTFNPDTLIIPHMGEAVTGVLEFDVDSRLLLSPSDIVGIYIDDRYYGSVESKDMKAVVYLYNFSEGPHTLSLGLINHKENHGLLNLTFEPYKKYTTKIFIDKTFPNPVSIKSAVYNDKVIKLEWSACRDRNFYYYLIQRYDKDNNQTFAKRIYDRNTTAFTDSTAPEVFGRNAGYYRVAVTNRANYVNSSEYKFDYGTPFPCQATVQDFAIYNPLYNEIYAATRNTITAVSCLDHSVKRDLLAINPGFKNQIFTFFLNNTKTKLYALCYDYYQNTYVFTRFDAATFKKEKSFKGGNFRLSNMAFPAADNAGKVYISDLDSLYIFDSEADTLLNKFGTANSFRFTISPDGKYLYGYHPGTSGNSNLEKFRILQTDLAPSGRISFSSGSDDMILSQDGKKIYVLNKKLCKMDVLSSESLSLEKTLEFSVTPNVNVTAFYVSNDFTYAALSESGQGRIAQFSLGSFKETATWKFYAPPAKLLATNDNNLLYSFSFTGYDTNKWENWIVRIR